MAEARWLSSKVASIVDGNMNVSLSKLIEMIDLEMGVELDSMSEVVEYYRMRFVHSKRKVLYLKHNKINKILHMKFKCVA